MVRLKRTTSRDKDFQSLVLELDSDLEARYYSMKYQYNAFTQLGNIKTVVVAYVQDIAVGCGCFRELDFETVEVKRMFVNPYFRGFGVASDIIDELLCWARQLYYKKALLETGRKQPESIRLYSKHGFRIIDNFGPYIGMEESVCMEKDLCPPKK